MFSRIREAARIIAYREPQTGADAVIVERKDPTASRAGKAIAIFFEVTAGVCTLGYVAGRIGAYIERVIPDGHRVASGNTIIGAVGVLLILILHWLRSDIEDKLRARIHLADALAPNFGHRLEHTTRILKG